jgi:hypothetical protein
MIAVTLDDEPGAAQVLAAHANANKDGGTLQRLKGVGGDRFVRVSFTAKEQHTRARHEGFPKHGYTFIGEKTVGGRRAGG